MVQFKIWPILKPAAQLLLLNDFIVQVINWLSIEQCKYDSVY